MCDLCMRTDIADAIADDYEANTRPVDNVIERYEDRIGWTPRPTPHISEYARLEQDRNTMLDVLYDLHRVYAYSPECIATRHMSRIEDILRAHGRIA